MRKLNAAALLSLLLLAACHRAPRLPILVLEECDPAGYLSCIPHEAFASIPVTDTGAYLTYSSCWTPRPSAQHAWDATGLGLGGWSINFVHRYDKADRLFISGDGSWRLADSVALPSGEQAVPSYDGSLAYIFDSTGRHVRTVDGRLGTDLLKISYDGAGRLATVDGFTNGQPVHVLVQRDSEGRAQSLVGADGGTTSLGLDKNGHLTSVTNPAGQSTRMTWNAAGMLESQTDPAGGVLLFTYDQFGRLATTTDADNVVHQFDYNVSSRAFEVRVSSAQGRHWSYRAESIKDGIRRTYTARDGTVTTETTDAKGNRLLKLADGTSYNIGASPNPVWGMAAPLLTPFVEFRPDGVSSRREVNYGLQPQHGIPYVLTGTVSTTINGQTWVQNFDPSQYTITLVDPAGRRTITTYDAQGRLTRYSHPGVAPVAYTYNDAGRVMSVTIGDGKSASTTRYSYNANIGEIVVTRPDGIILKRAVDKAGQPVSETAGDGSTILAAYTAAGHLMQVQPPGGFNYTLGTSPAGRDTGFAPPIIQEDGSVETTAYDKEGQVAAVSGPGRRAINYEYDSGGRVISSTFDQGKASISYDAHSGLRTRATEPGGVTTSYGYSGSALNSVTWSGPVNGSVSVTLDANGRAARENVNGSNSLDFAYDATGNLVGVGPLSLTRDANTGLVTRSTLGSIETKEEFDSNGRLSHSTTTVAGKVLLDQRYTRDSLGRIKTVVETEADGKPLTTEYSYDRADRLASVRVNGRLVETESYDPAGNRVGVVRSSSRVTARYDEREQLLNWGPVQYSWAPDGHMTQRTNSKVSDSFIYDDFSALRAAMLANNKAIKYYVDADGRRVGREVGGKLVAQYLYRSNGSLAAELDSSGKVILRFGYDDLGHLALLEHGGVTCRVITDPLGSPRLILDSRSGSIADEINYDAWGNVTRETAPDFIPIGFAGGLRDPDTGLIRFGARDYDPTTGRWTAADPIRFKGGDANLYRYAAGDPANLTDRIGLVICKETGRSTTCYDEPPTPLTPLTPPQNNPPPQQNPPRTPSPPNNGGSPWSCSGFMCAPQGFNHGGCMWGSCSGGPSGFSCTAVVCDDPNSDSTCFFCSIGDTHLIYDHGVHVDFQGAGEFLVASDPSGRLVVQARQEPSSSGTQVTFNTAVAANVNGDRVGVYAREPSFLVVNGVPADQPDVVRKLQHGGTLEAHGSVVRIAWPDGNRLTVTRIADILNYYFFANPNFTAPVRGLLGSTGHNGSDLVGRDGVALSRSDPEFQSKLYRQFGNSWRIKQSESLFHYWPGESTAKFTNLNIPSKPVTAASLSSDTQSKAQATCRAFGVQSQPMLDDCILDVGVTGIPAFAAAYAGLTLPTASSRTINASAGTPATPPSAPVPTASTSLATDQYAINIGDTVSPDHPAHGAGIIAQPGEHQSYFFPAQAGQIIYFRAANCDGAPVDFELYKPSKDSLGFARGDCGDLGPITLPTAGTYKIVAKADRGAAHYSFSVSPTTFEQYSIKIGDTVSPDHPSRGAGIIAQPGEQQSYSFQGRAGQIIYFRASDCQGASTDFQLYKPSNDSLGFGRGDCGDLGPVTLPTTGTYKVFVKVANGGASRYSFSLRPTTFEQYSIKIGDTVSPDHPSRGAGIIAQPGEQQSYSFQGRAGQIIYFRASDCQGASTDFQLYKPSNDSLGFGRGDCGDLGPVTLPKAGTYKVFVKVANGGASRYSFSLRPTTFEQYSIRIGDTVSPDHPSRGAGIIAQPGEQQSYSFQGRAGQIIYFRATNCEGGLTLFDLYKPSGNTLAGRGSCGDFGPVTLPEDGTYKVVVKVDHGGAARYSFRISGQPISTR